MSDEQPKTPYPPIYNDAKRFQLENKRMYLQAMPDTEKKMWGMIDFMNDLVERLTTGKLMMVAKVLLLTGPIFVFLGWSLAVWFIQILPVLAGAP